MCIMMLAVVLWASMFNMYNIYNVSLIYQHIWYKYNRHLVSCTQHRLLIISQSIEQIKTLTWWCSLKKNKENVKVISVNPERGIHELIKHVTQNHKCEPCVGARGNVTAWISAQKIWARRQIMKYFLCVTPRFSGHKFNNCKDISFEPLGGARGEVKGSPKSICFILWAPWFKKKK